MAATPGDTNINLPTFSGDISRFLGNANPDWNGLNSSLGKSADSRNYDFIYNGQIYRAGGAGDEAGRGIQQTGSVADRMGRQATLDRNAAIQPAIDSYNASKPEITQAYATERSRLTGEIAPLNERYQKLLDDIKGNQTTATNRQTLATNNEMAKRGISNDSGAYQQEMTNVLNPINQQYSSIEKDANMNHEDALRGISDVIAGLVPKETADQRAITQAIASLLADTGNKNVDTGLNLYSQGVAQSNVDRAFQETQKQSAIANALAELKAKQTTTSAKDNFGIIPEGSTVYDFIHGKNVYTAAKTRAAVGGNQPADPY